MLKTQEFKKLVGFNHTWLVIVSIVANGLSFPFIFLGDEIGHFNNEGLSHTLKGIFYSGILHFANLMVFYIFKIKDRNNNTTNTFKLFFARNYPTHLLVTAVISILMAVGPFKACDVESPFILIAKNVIGTSILMSVIVGFYETAFYMTAYARSVKEREELKRKNVESQLEILKNQVQPHFLFNSLNTLASIIPEEPTLAVKYVQSLSKVYRYILEIKDKKLIPVYEEMKCVQAYLFMLETRFGENLRCNINLEKVEENHYIVPLSIQMLIENAVKHNVISSKRTLQIDICASQGTLTVSNNLQLKEMDVITTGTGLQNISSRYGLTAGKEVIVKEDVDRFSVHLPLIEVEI